MFAESYETFWQEFGPGKTMVLATALDDHVTARMMSVVCLVGKLYFQTDKTFRKYTQLTGNPRVALCIDNIQIEGVCRELGHPLENAAFCAAYKSCFAGSFARYTALQNERLFVVEPRFVERWTYQDGAPCIQTWDVENKTYTETPYEGR